ncbi:glucose N-acetyltransferase [Emericellopsis atlantica]|uniref:Glucose N-acetyltransferase n=1 Tax=Emericellopsis atlantica TaxID=2614577 RepID=A0A9P8CMH4_9HYPO|nr:glucose N-acetyltransferase [Emericellopsis atlantica]KAG9252448.1 glucose N-acetyltransferase [Emericellopsis atlantica]
MFSASWTTKWLRLAATALVGLLVCAAIFSSYQVSDITTPWWSLRRSDHQDTAETEDANKDTSTEVPPSSSDVDWSRFAYTQYATDSEYLCNSVMLFEALHRLGSRADRVLMYPSHMMPNIEVEQTTTDDQRLLRKAAEQYKVRLVPVEVQHRSGDDATWADSFTKLLAFNQTQYSRVLSLDSDSTLLQSMDELFLLPDCPVALPRAYWLLPDNVLSSQVLLIQPTEHEFNRVYDAIGTAGDDDYDMEIVNNLYKDNAMILPHRSYDMLTGEFRNLGEHVHYLGNGYETWDPVAHFNEAKFLHFSDWPVPKPWHQMSDKLREEKQPACRQVEGVEKCVEREMWNDFYDDFRERRDTSETTTMMPAALAYVIDCLDMSQVADSARQCPSSYLSSEWIVLEASRTADPAYGDHKKEQPWHYVPQWDAQDVAASDRLPRA